MQPKIAVYNVMDNFKCNAGCYTHGGHSYTTEGCEKQSFSFAFVLSLSWKLIVTCMKTPYKKRVGFAGSMQCTRLGRPSGMLW